MSAEVLRRAAEKLERLANDATPGPWEVLWNAVAYVDTVPDPSDPTGQTPMRQPEKVADAANHDREYIAAVNPEVGKFLAEWLRKVGRDAYCASPGEADSAVEIARAILGGDQ